MLESCVLHPDIYDFNSIENDFYFECLYSFLDMILRNGIILEDHQGNTYNSIKKYISEWPKDNNSKRIQNKLQALYNSNRVIRTTIKDMDLKFECKGANCSVFYSILIDNNATAIIPERCYELKSSNNEYIKLSQFTSSDLYNRINKRTELYSKDEWMKMKDRVLIPILKYTNSVKIIDRVFGNHINNKDIRIKDEYKDGLENIIKIICDHNINTQKVLVELYVAFEFDKSSQLQLQFTERKISVIQSFINELSNKYKIRIKCYYKNNYSDLPHDRFILTKQVGIQIGRGLDFMDKRGNLRPMIISLLEDEQKKKIENQVRLADNF